MARGKRPPSYEEIVGPYHPDEPIHQGAGLLHGPAAAPFMAGFVRGYKAANPDATDAEAAAAAKDALPS